MKRSHIIALIFVAILVASLTVMLGNSFSRYENFESSYAKQGKEFTVVGYLNKEKGVELLIMNYNPETGEKINVNSDVQQSEPEWDPFRD